MAYSTGTAASLQDLHDQLSTFMQANGWTLLDTVDAADKVFTSNGIDGKQNMTYRLTTTDAATYPFKFAANPHKAFKYLTVRGYAAWNAATDTGTNEFGYFGTIMQMGGRQTTGVSSYLRIEEDAAYPTISTMVTPDHFSKTQPFWNWDGRNKFIERFVGQSNGNPWSIMDFSGDTRTNTSLGVTTYQSGGALVHDYATDKDFLYKPLASTAVADHWWRFDVEANTWTRLVNPGWTGNQIAATCVWDGNDTIYLMQGSDTTAFRKYSISAGTWTTLAVLPLLRRSAAWHPGAEGHPNNMVYIPAALSGLTEDCIYAITEAGPYNGAATIIYRYDVTSNVWRSTTGTGALASPHGASFEYSAGLQFDGIKYLYFFDSRRSSNIYRMDVAVPGTWTNLGSMDTVLPGWWGMSLIKTLVGKVRAHNTTTCKYHFIGDADGVTIVTQIAASTPHSYWMRFGKFNTYYRNTIMTMTAATSAGSRQTFSVDSTTGFMAGDTVQVCNPATSASELVTIYDVPSATTFRASCLNSHASGSRVGVDPIQHGIVSDHGFAVMPSGVRGFKKDYEQDYYFASPLLDLNGRTRATPSVRGQYAPVPMMIYHPVTTLSRYENRGSVSGVFALASGAYPKPTEGDKIVVEGKEYLVFNVTEKALTANDSYLVVVGPIN